MRFNRIVFILPLVIALAAGIAVSEENHSGRFGAPLAAEELGRAVARISSVQKDIHAITADIYQKKKNPLLKKEIETEGTITLKRPNLLNWSTSRPEHTSIIADGNTMWVFNLDRKEAKKHLLAENFQARQIMDFFSSSMSLSLDTLSGNFNIAGYNHDGSIVLELKPRAAIAAKYVAAIYIWYRDGEGIPFRFELDSKKGSTITELKNVAINPPIKEDMFHFEPPKGTTIINLQDEGTSY